MVYNNDIEISGYPILDSLGHGNDGARVFDITILPNGRIRFTEACDICFSKDLTQDEVRGLAAELLRLIE